MSARATYRLQFHRGFTFADAAAHLDYFKRLGITDIYASPVLRARAGSTHGYDVTDPTMVNPELGGEEGLRDFAGRLHGAGLGLIVDIVPNHMAASPENPWWADVLAYGEDSAYAKFFDIDWRGPDPDLQGKLLLPILGRPYDEALREGDLALDADEAGTVALRYGDHRLPLRGDDPLSPEAAAALTDIPGGLADILERQHYRLAYWREAGARINWRRFFDINELAALRMECAEVFEAAHAKIFELYEAGVIDGLRLDHVDGLTDPAAYCRLLRQRLTEIERRRPWGALLGPAPIYVEKILGARERMPYRWRTDGTTGYEFMNAVSALQHDGKSEADFTALWRELSGRALSFEEEERLARGEMIDGSFAGQFANAVAAMRKLLARLRPDLAASEADCGEVLRVMLQSFPIYRTYATRAGAAKSDVIKLARIKDAARAHLDERLLPLLNALCELLAGRAYGDSGIPDLAVRLQKLSAPLAAKSVEDTAFYRYGRLLSRNDVGFDAARFSGNAQSFHDFCIARAVDFPRALSATATHDHKRGEDVRARLAVLSELPQRWRAEVQSWRALARQGRFPELDGGDEYQLFQTLLGAWPLELTADDLDGLAAFAARVKQWQTKAMREAKLRSSWANPDAAYEASGAAYIDRALSSPEGAPLRQAVHRFAQEIAPAGALNGLSQALLRCLAPGTPDLYQGCEFWDFSLVDPDNRRPVDYAAREQALGGGEPAALLAQWRDGRVKQAAIASALAVRRRYGALFAEGSYEPLIVEGPRAASLLAFARRAKSHAALVILPRLCAEASIATKAPLPAASYWDGTRVQLPEYCAGAHAIDGSHQERLPRQLDVSDLLRAFPAAFFICGIRS